MQRELIEGNPVLVVIDIQGGETKSDDESGIPLMPGYDAAMDRAPGKAPEKKNRLLPSGFLPG